MSLRSPKMDGKVVEKEGLAWIAQKLDLPTLSEPAIIIITYYPLLRLSLLLPVKPKAPRA